MAGYGGAFSKWARGGGDLRKATSLASSKIGSHPIGQIEETLKSGRAPERQPPASSSSEPYSTAPRKPGKVPEMLNSKYWRPGGK